MMSGILFVIDQLGSEVANLRQQVAALAEENRSLRAAAHGGVDTPDDGSS
jgi:outer membrane murein-binding lipoprotein Lpp